MTVLPALALVCLTAGCNSPGLGRNSPVEVTMRPEGQGCGELCVVLRNRAEEDLIFDRQGLPWALSGRGSEFILSREDGSVIGKKPLIADPVVSPPVLIQPGRRISHTMSLVWYYLDLEEELARNDIRVTWSYSPRPANLSVTNVLRGEFLLKRQKPGAADERGRGMNLIGTWSGLEDGSKYEYELALEPDGTGILFRRRVGVESDHLIFSVSKWSAQGKSLRLALTRRGWDSPVAAGSIQSASIRLLIEDEGWSHTATLRKQAADDGAESL